MAVRVHAARQHQQPGCVDHPCRVLDALGQGPDGQSVPIRQHLVVAPRPRSLFPDGEERLSLGLEIRPRRAETTDPVEDGLALPVAVRRDVVAAAKVERVRADHRIDLGSAPDVECALLAVTALVEAVGVERGCQSAALDAHLAREPSDGLVDSDPEQIVAGRTPAPDEMSQELGVVVEHLLEMRHQPAIVSAVAV